jgi:glucose/arabinose dehydrogenase
MKYFFLIFLFSINLSLLSAITYSDNYSYKIIVSEIEVPWGFVFLEDNSILITERKGELIHFINGKKIKIKGLPEIIAKNQGGLLDIELHPEYKNNGWIYISYSSSNENKSGSNTSIMRFKIEKNSMIQKEIIIKLYQIVNVIDIMEAELNLIKIIFFISQLEIGEIEM